MTELRNFQTSIYDFATKVMSAVESQGRGTDRSSQVTATIAFAGDVVSRNITIACTAALNTGDRRRVEVWGRRVTAIETKDVQAYGDVRSRAGPRTQQTGQEPSQATTKWRSPNEVHIEI